MAVLLIFAMLVMAVNGQSYAENGPYAFSRLRWKHAVAEEGGNGVYLLDFKITFPTDAGKNVACPIVFLYSGFEMASSFYTPYAQKLASWGYVVVQYDVPMLPIITDETEVSFFPYVLEWITSQMREAELPTNVDYDAVVVGGHSRGGKLAALIATRNPYVKALFLIDPVDGDGKHSQGQGFPSAVAALKDQNIKMVIAGSSVSGSCNPKDYDFHHFWSTAGEGSWLAVIANAGHAQFFSAPPARQWILNRICKSGKTTCKTVIDNTTPSLVAWLESTLRPQRTNVEEMDNMSSLDEFFLWVQSKVKSGALTFTIKGQEAVV